MDFCTNSASLFINDSVNFLYIKYTLTHKWK